jgi:CRISPR-associated endonuclease/helicase Cas3
MKEEYIAHIKELEKDWDIQTIDVHAEGVASLAGQAASAFHASAWAELCGKWHDLGKYSSEFQQHIKAASGYDLALHDPGKVDHATAGAVFARQLLGQEGLYLPIAYCICGHHAGLHDYDGAGAANLHHHLQETDKMERLPDKLLAQKLLICRYLTYLGRIFHVSGICGSDAFLLPCRADSLDTERFMNPEQYASRGQFDDLPVLKERLDRYLRKFEGCAPTLLNRTRRSYPVTLSGERQRSTRHLQSDGAYWWGQDAVVYAVALEHALANGCRRIIIAIPYTSIVVQTASVLKGIFGEDNVVEHHSNADLDSETTAVANLQRKTGMRLSL